MVRGLYAVHEMQGGASVVIHDPNHLVLSRQGERIGRRCKPSPQDGFVAIDHMEEFLDLGVLIHCSIGNVTCHIALPEDLVSDWVRDRSAFEQVQLAAHCQARSVPDGFRAKE